MQVPMQARVQTFAPPKTRGGSWVRKVEHWAVRFFSLVFSVVTAHAIWWFFSSALNWLDQYQWMVTLLMAVGFAGLGFIISRGLSHRLQHKEPLGVVVFIVAVFELVEVGACFAQAAVSISHINWLTAFQGGMHGFLTFLCYLLLPIVPFFTIALAWFDMDLDREKVGEKPAPAPKADKKAKQAPVPAAAPFNGAPGGLATANPLAPTHGYRGPLAGTSSQPQSAYPSMTPPGNTAQGQAPFFGLNRSQGVPQPEQQTMAMPGPVGPYQR
ncbi:hypothetical protein [Dictyobacter aurantiacus]|uniref:Uncharacterized protein n=1 Tax=Dictyobacter aurantiacus TaxID=1936993 RepID=A0A401ZFT7_9CHLR|nr:hypothetical protein [Dictyobacter aurantiacus]GCE05760.1 hypothetical protein KDAU_30890 [Dictyobacter aurantiacus]